MKRSRSRLSVRQSSWRSPSPSECHTTAALSAGSETGARSSTRSAKDASRSARIPSVCRLDRRSDQVEPPTSTERKSQAAAMAERGRPARKKRSFQSRNTKAEPSNMDAASGAMTDSRFGKSSPNDRAAMKTPGPASPISGNAIHQSAAGEDAPSEPAIESRARPVQTRQSAMEMHQRAPRRSISSPYATITPSAAKRETEESETKDDACALQQLRWRSSPLRAAQAAASSAAHRSRKAPLEYRTG
mmetsp:Transcript_58/g.199  ORF Transcript_58/g.199 Transcript_58/m.199 type:complete len:246 (+) Transcript_58:942-1679(+)